MDNLIPPLKQLIALELVAKHNSFTKAAVELNVTHSAISQSIKLLEAYLGYTIFERNTHMVNLTRIGEIYHEEIVQSLDLIRSATRRLMTNERTLTVNMQTTFAARWFNSRMEEFLENNPSIAFRLSTLRRTIKYSDFEKHQIDLSIDFGKSGDWGDCIEEKLINDKLVLVASPGLIKAREEFDLNRVFEMYKCIIISQTLRKDDYKRWCEAISIEEPPPVAHIYYLGTHQALNAVIQGDGVLVTHKILVADAIENGSLVILSEVDVAESYFLVYPRTGVNIHTIGEFRKWIRNAL